MPGIGSAWMKLRTNSSASGPDALLSFSVTADWRYRWVFSFSRLNSVAVKPKRAARLISVKSALSPRSTPPGGTSATSDVTSAVRTKRPRSVSARRNGAFGELATSSRRADIIALNRRSTIARRHLANVAERGGGIRPGAAVRWSAGAGLRLVAAMEGAGYARGGRWRRV